MRPLQCPASARNPRLCGSSAGGALRTGVPACEAADGEQDRRHPTRAPSTIASDGAAGPAPSDARLVDCSSYRGGIRKLPSQHLLHRRVGRRD
jgi:hypothetical protein